MGVFGIDMIANYLNGLKPERNSGKKKLDKNAQNDSLNQKKLSDLGWRVCVVWECSIRGADKDPVAVKDRIVKWILSDSAFLEVRE